MIIFPAQLDGFSSRGDGSRILKLSTYQQYSGEVSKATNMEIGTEFFVVLMPTGDKETETFVTETKEETKERFRKRMNCLINQIAEREGSTPSEFRESFKTELKNRKMIKESTKELSIEGYASAIVMLTELLK